MSDKMIVPIKSVHNFEEQTFEIGDRCWFVTRLAEKSKDLPIQEMPITALNTYMLHPTHDTMSGFVCHVKKVINADMSYPIILDDEGYVMDGRHRIAKALLEGLDTIKFVRFEETPPCDYITPKTM